MRSRINEVENDMKRTNLEKKEMEDLISSNHRSHEEESRSLQRSKTLLQDEIFNMHCLGLFERYDSIEDIKRRIN